MALFYSLVDVKNHGEANQIPVDSKNGTPKSAFPVLLLLIPPCFQAALLEHVAEKKVNPDPSLFDEDAFGKPPDGLHDDTVL